MEALPARKATDIHGVGVRKLSYTEMVAEVQRVETTRGTMSSTTDLRDAAILRKLRSLAKRYGGGWFYQKHWKIAELCKCSVSTLQRALRRLTAPGGPLEVNRRWLVMPGGGKMMLANEYRLAASSDGESRSVKKTDQRVSPVYLVDKQAIKSDWKLQLREVMQRDGVTEVTAALLRNLELRKWA